MTVPLVLLLTDYGPDDVYVAPLHVAVHRVAPDARVVDLFHGVAPGDVSHAAFLLWAFHHTLPAEAVVCAVVDPGVGTARPLVAARRGEGPTYVAPDTGLLGFLRTDFPDCPDREEPLEAAMLEDETWWGPQRSATFHGRDILAPVSAYVAQGTPLGALGPLLAREPQPCAELWPDVAGKAGTAPTIEGRIRHLDRFGNAITNVRGRLLEAGRDWRLRWDGGEAAGPQTTFADVAPGEPVWYVGSTGFVELALNQGSARDRFGLRPGAAMTLVAAQGRAADATS